MQYAFKNRQLPAHERGGNIDPRIATTMNDLALPMRDSYDAPSNAVTTGLVFLKLHRLRAGR